MSNQDNTDLRVRILEEAARLFVEHGYNGIAMREIAEAVGVSKAGLYYHFRDKEDLFLAILYEALARNERVVRQARALSGGVRAQVAALARGLLAEPGSHRAIIRLASHELAQLSQAARNEFGRRYQSQFIGQVAGLLEDASARGEIRPLDSSTLTWLLLGMLYPLLAQGGGAPPEAVVTALLDVFFDGAAA